MKANHTMMVIPHTDLSEKKFSPCALDSALSSPFLVFTDSFSLRSVSMSLTTVLFFFFFSADGPCVKQKATLIPAEHAA